jgi:hypothetical protein
MKDNIKVSIPIYPLFSTSVLHATCRQVESEGSDGVNVVYS